MPIWNLASSEVLVDEADAWPLVAMLEPVWCDLPSGRNVELADRLLAPQLRPKWRFV